MGSVGSGGGFTSDRDKPFITARCKFLLISGAALSEPAEMPLANLGDFVSPTRILGVCTTPAPHGR